MIFVPEALLGAVAAVASLGISSIVKSLLERRQHDVTLGLNEKSQTITASEDLNPSAIERRIKAYAQLAPSIAIIEAWRVLEALAKLATRTRQISHEQMALPADQLLARENLLSGEALRRMGELRGVRNSLVHGGNDVDGASLALVIDDLKQIAELVVSSRSRPAE